MDYHTLMDPVVMWQPHTYIWVSLCVQVDVLCGTHVLTDRVTESEVIALCTEDGKQASNAKVQRSFDKQSDDCHDDEDGHLRNQDGQQEVPVHLQNLKIWSQYSISTKYEIKL